MRFLLALIISFQFVAGPVTASELGETKPFTVKDHLINSMAKAEAKDFEEHARLLVEKVSKEGVKSIATDEYALSRANRKPVFVEKTPGSWELKSEGHKLSFTLNDLHQGQMLLDGKILKFKGVSLPMLEKDAEKILEGKKVSFLNILFNKTIGIESAEALVPLLIIVGILAVALIGAALQTWMLGPKKIVQRLNELKAKLDSDAVACNEAKNDSSKYDQTFSLASNISSKSSTNSTSAADAMELALKEQMQRGNRNNQDCFQIMHDLGKRARIDIPMMSPQEVSRRENAAAVGIGAGIGSDPYNVGNAAFNLCSSYNQLGSCMENFVAAHVNDSGIDSFKEQATQSHWRYQRKAGVGRQ